MDVDKWIKLDQENIKQVPEKPGAYRIAIFHNDKPMTIKRFIDEDKEGIIDIGETVNLRKRLRRLKKNIDVGSGGHMAGWRFNYLKLNEKFDDLRFDYIITSSKKEAYKSEHEWMKSYLDKHKELPPMNYKYNWADE